MEFSAQFYHKIYSRLSSQHIAVPFGCVSCSSIFCLSCLNERPSDIYKFISCFYQVLNKMGMVKRSNDIFPLYFMTLRKVQLPGLTFSISPLWVEYLHCSVMLSGYQTVIKLQCWSHCIILKQTCLAEIGIYSIDIWERPSEYKIRFLEEKQSNLFAAKFI